MRATVISLCIACALGRTASAQNANAEAEALFRQGVALMDAGQLTEACAAFDASEQRAPAVTTLFNQAACREKNGQFATAWGWYVEAERQTRGSADPTMQTLHQVAQDHAAKLEPRLSKLTINVPPKARVPGFEITRETVAVDLEEAGRPLPVDGGRYTITAHAPGYTPWKITIEIGREGDVKTIEVPILRAVTDPVIEPPSKTVPLVLAGGALVLAGVGVGFELSAESTYNQYRTVGGDSPLFDSANHKRYAAEGFAVGGIACLSVAAFLYFHHGETAPNTVRLQLAPSVDTNHAGLVIVGRF